MRQGFYTDNGWYWRRTDDGSVVVELVDHATDEVIAYHQMKPEQWASVVSSVSAGGEAKDGFYLALAFHGDPRNPPHLANVLTDDDPTMDMGPSPVCHVCDDTHRMQLGCREVPCTHCPRPCVGCAWEGIGAYCERTPCHCDCHTGVK